MAIKKIYRSVLYTVLLGSFAMAVAERRKITTHVIQQRIRSCLDRLMKLEDTSQQEAGDLELQLKEAMQEVRNNLADCIAYFGSKERTKIKRLS